MKRTHIKKASASLSLIICAIFLPLLLFAQIQQDSILEVKFEPDTIQIPYAEIELDCLRIRKNKYVVIRSYEQMIALFKHTNDLDCIKFSPTEFDFKKEVIIGFFAVLARSGKKLPTIDILIEEITHQNKIRCEVNIIDYPGGGMMSSPVNKIITFPIKSNDWDIEVDIIDYKNRFTQTNKSCYDN